MIGRILGLIGLGLLLAACGRQSANTSTSAPVATLAPSPTQLVRATLPPSWTPALSWTPTASYTFTPTNTWTPTITPSLTFTPSDTPTPNATNVFLIKKTLPADCATFGADPVRNPSQFRYTTSPTVIWTTVNSAALYVLRLYDQNSLTLLTDTTTDTSYTFDANLFQLSQTYAWDVAPLDADGVQLCPSRGALLVPSS